MPVFSNQRMCSALFALAIGVACAPTEEPGPELLASAAGCSASSSWVTSPSPPADVGDGNVKDQTNCQFYQFSWQWFLSLVSPGSSGERRFESDLRVFTPGATDQCASAAPKGQRALADAMFVRVTKSTDASAGHVLPAELAQATDNPLYDQSGNVVLYTIGYSDNECDATDAGYLPDTIETKVSWRQLAEDDPQLDSYYTIQATVDAISTTPITLGLVGFHLVMNTSTHPEFIWATFEHKSNNPDCTHPAAAPASGWSFTSAKCAGCLSTGTVDSCQSTCDFNGTSSECSNQPGGTPCQITGTATEVCRVYPDGTDPGSKTKGNDNDLNRANIDTLNEQLVGADGILTELAASNPMSVWQNYQLVGGLWTNGGVASGGTDVQRGSLELANTTMETFFQTQGFNCFTCHNYDPSSPLKVSHIADDLGILPK